MSDFSFYFTLGWEHIMSWDALDHILFVLALSAIYLPQHWKQILILITAFTVGHSLTLALSTFDVIRLGSNWVEFLIPLTIVITAFLNLIRKDLSVKSLRLQYFLALFFGLIHGMGFANTIRFMLAKKESIFTPLLGFNVGLEVGQIIVVALILLLCYLFVNIIGLKRIIWIRVLSSTALIISLIICIQRIPYSTQ